MEGKKRRTKTRQRRATVWWTGHTKEEDKDKGVQPCGGQDTRKRRIKTKACNRVVDRTHERGG